MAKRKYEIVEVEWLDSIGQDAWQDLDELLDTAKKPNRMMQYTAGYLVKKTRNYVIVTLAHSDTDSAGTIGHTMQIPLGVVQKIRVMREK